MFFLPFRSLQLSKQSGKKMFPFQDGWTDSPARPGELAKAWLWSAAWPLPSALGRRKQVAGSSGSFHLHMGSLLRAWALLVGLEVPGKSLCVHIGPGGGAESPSYRDGWIGPGLPPLSWAGPSASRWANCAWLDSQQPRVELAERLCRAEVLPFYGEAGVGQSPDAGLLRLQVLTTCPRVASPRSRCWNDPGITVASRHGPRHMRRRSSLGGPGVCRAWVLGGPRGCPLTLMRRRCSKAWWMVSLPWAQGQVEPSTGEWPLPAMWP